MKDRMYRERVLLKGVLALVLVVLLGVFVQDFCLTSYAATGTITARSVNVRKEPSTSSEIIASVSQGNTVTVNSKTTGADNKIWYQVAVDANSVGYIRSDLISVSEDVPDENGGTVPPDQNPAQTPTVTVTPVQPLAATVTGSDAVRVRWDAVVAADNIIAQLSSGTAVTIIGQATDADNNLWYQATFTNEGAEVQGFIRADYVTLSGEIVPVDTTQPSEPSQPDTQEPQQNIGNQDLDCYAWWGVGIDGGEEEWWICYRPNGYKYRPRELVEYYLKASGEEIPGMQGTIRTQRIIIVVMVILLILAVSFGVLLFIKLRDMVNQEFYNSVEKDALQERKAKRQEREGQEGSQKKPATVGADGSRPKDSQRSQTGVSAQNGARSASQGGQGSQTRPAAGQGRPASSQSGRPVTGSGQVRSTASQSGQVRPAASQSGQGRPAASQSGSSRPVSSAGTQARPSQPGNQARQNAQQVMKQAQNQMPGGQVRPATVRTQGTASRPVGGSNVRPVQRPVQPDINPMDNERDLDNYPYLTHFNKKENEDL